MGRSGIWWGRRRKLSEEHGSWWGVSHSLSPELHLGTIRERPEHGLLRSTDVETSGNTTWGGGAEWEGGRRQHSGSLQPQQRRADGSRARGRGRKAFRGQSRGHGEVGPTAAQDVSTSLPLDPVGRDFLGKGSSQV